MKYIKASATAAALEFNVQSGFEERGLFRDIGHWVAIIRSYLITTPAKNKDNSKGTDQTFTRFSRNV